jgi:hypothetical protein
MQASTLLKKETDKSRLVDLIGFCKYGRLDLEHASGKTINTSLGLLGVR